MSITNFLRYFGTAMSFITIATLVGCSGGGSGGTETDEFVGAMTGAQVVPPVNTTSSATFTATLAPDQSYLDITIIHNVPDVTAIHLHGPAAVGQNGPVIFDVLANGTITPLPARPEPQQVMIEARIVEINPDLLSDLGVDLTYLQIHSKGHPAGVLRGQLTNTPAGNPNIDVLLTDASLTYVESLELSQVRNNAASIGIHNNSSDALNVLSFVEFNLLPYDFFGPGVDISDPDPDDVSTVTTTVDPLGSIEIGVELVVTPTVSADDQITLNLTPGLGATTQVDANIRLAVRMANTLVDVRDVATTIGGLNLEERLIPRLGSVPILSRLLSDGLQSGTAQARNLIILVGATLIDSEVRSGARGIDPFPCGPITDGIVVCPVDQGAANLGSRLMVTMVLDDDVPVADPTNSYQYGFVFDSDGNPNNNFVPLPAFPADFFQGTDKWYYVTYTPLDGWQLWAVDASGQGNPIRVLTDAKVIIRNNAIVLSVPQSEFVLDNPSYRATSFRHSGDFGVGGDFDVSYHPGLNEVLEPVVLP